MTGSLSTALSKYAVSARLDEMKAGDVAHAVDAFVNFVGCAIGGAHTPTVDAAVRGYQSVLGEGGHAVLGRPERFNLFEAIFVDCLSSAVLSFDDTHLETILHPTGPIASALIGLARTRRISGRDYIAAQIVGMEVQCRAALAFTAAGTGSNRAWYSTGLTGGIGAAAAVGRILGFDGKLMLNAFGLAAASGCGNRGTHGSMARASVRAFAGENGFKAAVMTEAGFTCGARAFDGHGGLIELVAPKPAIERALSDLGSVSEAARTAFKPYPCGIVLHPVIDAAFLLAKRGVAADDIRELSLQVPKATADLGLKKHPRSDFDSQVSVYYWAAAALVTGSAGMAQLDEAMIADARIGSLQDRIQVSMSPELQADQCVAVAKLVDGRSIEVRVEHATGSVDRPMTSAEIDAKFKSLAVAMNSSERAERLWTTCRHVMDLDDVSAILTI